MARRVNSEFVVIKLDPLHYLHVKDTNTNLVNLITGPRTVTCLEHEKVVYGPAAMVVIPPRHYVIIENPVIRKVQYDEEGREISSVVITDDNGQAMIRYGEKEVRFEQPPFPLYDGERCGPIVPLQLVESNTALRLKALRDFEDRYDHGVKRRVGEEWLFPGRSIYYPQVEVEVVETITASRLKSTEALKVKAINDCKDYQNRERRAGEEWLVKVEGLYLPQVNERIVERIKGYILTPKSAIHVRAKNKFTDEKGVLHKAGTEWLVTHQDTEIYFPDVYEEVTKRVELNILGPHDYCIIADPVDEHGKPQLGSLKMVKGCTTFFLHPGETLKEMSKSNILYSPDGLWVTCKEEFVDEGGVRRRPGDIWLITGPGLYWKPIQVVIDSHVKAVVAIESLGIYIFRPVVFIGAIIGLLFLIYFTNSFLSL